MQSVEAIIRRVRADERKILTEPEAKAILAAIGIVSPPGLEAADAEAAGQAAEQLGYPVAVKILSPDITHKSDMGGVRLNLQTAAEVVEAAREVIQAAQQHQQEARVWGVYVQRMAPRSDYELIIGAMQDPQFGPVVVFGLGGILVEVQRDVALRVAPINRREARQMMREIRAYPVLQGVRGRPPADLEAIATTIEAVSQLAHMYSDDLSELDINPVFAYTQGIMAVDARIILR